MTVPPGTGRLLVFPGSLIPRGPYEAGGSGARRDETARRRGSLLVYEISLEERRQGCHRRRAGRERLLQFKKANAAVALTRERYVEKSQLFGPCDFVMGATHGFTCTRCGTVGGVEGLRRPGHAAERGCGFVVAGRLGERLSTPTAGARLGAGQPPHVASRSRISGRVLRRRSCEGAARAEVAVDASMAAVLAATASSRSLSASAAGDILLAGAAVRRRQTGPGRPKGPACPGVSAGSLLDCAPSRLGDTSRHRRVSAWGCERRQTH